MVDINITDFRTITGTEEAEIDVPAGMQLTLLGIAGGIVRVQPGGRLYLGGVQNGALYVADGAEVVIRGRLIGSIAQNDGTIEVAEGAFVGDQVMTSDGLRQPTSGTTYTVTDSTPTHRVRGTGGALTLS